MYHFLTKENIVGIYLAAGNSTRFGSNKLIEPLHGIPLGSYALYAAVKAKLDKIILVTKECDLLEWVQPSLKKHFGSKIVTVICKQSSEEGQSASLKCGLTVAKNMGATAIVILLADQPFITTTFLNTIITHYKNNHFFSFVGARNKNVVSPPILISKRMFPQLAKLTGDKGAREIIQTYLEEGYLFALKNGENFIDVDTKGDFVEVSQKIMEKKSYFPGNDEL